MFLRSLYHLGLKENTGNRTEPNNFLSLLVHGFRSGGGLLSSIVVMEMREQEDR